MVYLRKVSLNLLIQQMSQKGLESLTLSLLIRLRTLK